MANEDPLMELPSEVASDLNSFYDLLEVSYNAPTEDIKAAYRSKIRQYHPDTCDKEYAEEMTYALNQAIDTLGSQGKRMSYNELGHKEYLRQRAFGSDTTTMESAEEESYTSSIYELIQMAKINTYTRDPWWRVILRSNGFKLAIGVTLLLTLLFGMLLVI